MKKGLKITLWCVVAAVPVGLIVGLCIPQSGVTHISTVGSSGVKPFVETLSEDYTDYMKKQNDEEYDITVDAGGSGFGIGQVAKGYTDIGNASKNPYEGVQKEYQSQWQERDIKTITIGWEGICVVYIPPSGISNDAKSKLNQTLDLNVNNITNLYRVFSGYSDGLPQQTKKPTFGLFLNDEVNLSASDKEKFQQQKITPYARSGGSLTSGTASSFYESSHLENATEGLTDRQKNAFKYGTYGSDWKLYDTDEANSRAWDIFHRNNIPGSMVYLSSGFIKANEKLIKDSGYGILSYSGVSFDASKIKTDNGYNFYRPLNIMLSIEDEKSQSFAEYLISDQTADKWVNLGAKQVDQQDIDSMCKDGQFWVDDIDITMSRYPEIETIEELWTHDDLIFGADD